MSRWFRWYEGTSEDGKFRVVARNADVTVATVTGVWAVLLEDASHPDHRGIALRGVEFYCAILDIDEPILIAVLNAMQSVELIKDGLGSITITKWKERQFESDSSDPTNADRQRRFRSKRKGNDDIKHRNGDEALRNGAVVVTQTATKRPDTEIERKKERKEEEVKNGLESVTVSPRDPVLNGTMPEWRALWTDNELADMQLGNDQADIMARLPGLYRWATETLGLTKENEIKLAVSRTIRKEQRNLEAAPKMLAMKHNPPSPEISASVAASRLAQKSQPFARRRD